MMTLTFGITLPWLRFLACGSKVLSLIILYFVFALAEGKNEIQKENKVPLRIPTFGHRVSPANQS
jgi:hypothetical protein